MGVKKRTIDDLKEYFLSCIKKDGLVVGKRRFFLELGMVENAIFAEIDNDRTLVSQLEEVSRIGRHADEKLEVLPVVDENCIGKKVGRRAKELE